MLYAIASMYGITKSVLGIALVTAFVGVRQGSPTSCLLFNVFMNDLITMIKTRSPNDGFLKWLHLLMLMDDTVIIATSRTRFIDKMSLVFEFCDENDIAAVLLSIDFEKAFDKLDRNFLWNCMKFFKIPDNIIKWVKTLYAGAVSCVTNNGHIYLFISCFLV